MPFRAMLRCLYSVLLITLLPLAVNAQPSQLPAPRIYNAQNFGDQVNLDQGWLFHPGDDPSFASPSLDDRTWQSIDLQKPLASYGFPPTLRYGWLRIHVQLPATTQPIVLGLENSNGRYQAFVNGILIGATGNMGYHTLYERDYTTRYAIPIQLTNLGAQNIVVAFRFSLQAPAYEGPGPESPFANGSVVLGTARALSGTEVTQFVFEWASDAIGVVISLLIGLVALALFLSLRAYREYLYLSLYGFFNSASQICFLLMRFIPSGIGMSVSLSIFDLAFFIAMIEFTREILGLRRSRFILLLELITVPGLATLPLFAAGLVSYAATALNEVSYLVADLLLLLLLLRGARRGGPEARVLDARILFLRLLPFTAANAFDVLNRVRIAAGASLTPYPTLQLGSFQVEYNTLAALILQVVLLVFLIMRTIRIARERARVANEIGAAQSMQRLLLARASEPTPGFSVESVYLPASEVGGDFFLVSPDPNDGSLTAIVGDVSGKGLTAAMRVAMILGVLRREDSREPATILRRLNHALLTQNDLGFTTACCVHLQPDGSFAVANAGHISPYIDGREVATSPGLPLGLAEWNDDSDLSDLPYEPLRGRLPYGTRMVLMSDGVVEARSEGGELYGFDRLNALTLRSAKEIAATAQAFGQEDDITVLTLACTASELVSPGL